MPNMKKLAEALRGLSKLAYKPPAYKGFEGMLFQDAAAACEEEGEGPLNKSTLMKLIERIAALEARVDEAVRHIKALEPLPTGYPAPPVGGVIGGDPPPAPEEPCAHGIHFANCRVCSPPPAAASAAPSGREDRILLEETDRVAHDWADLADERLGLLRRVGVAEDPSEYADDVARHIDKYRDYKLPAPAPEDRCFHGVPGTACRACNGPAPPEQAQEMAYREGIYVLRPGERIVKSGSPLFDKIDSSANCGCSYDSIGSTILYCAEHTGDPGPGAEAPSGEGVRVHRFGATKRDAAGPWVECNGIHVGSGWEHGVVHPDAPPRAEEK